MPHELSFIVLGGAIEVRVAGDVMLLACPRAEVDQAAACRAERPMLALLGPRHRLLAVGTCNDLRELSRHFTIVPKFAFIVAVSQGRHPRSHNTFSCGMLLRHVAPQRPLPRHPCPGSLVRAASPLAAIRFVPRSVDIFRATPRPVRRAPRAHRRSRSHHRRARSALRGSPAPR